MRQGLADLARAPGRLAALLEASDEVVLAFLHGSGLTEARPRDLDVAILVDPDRVGAGKELDCALAMADTLTRALGFPVDVQILNHAPAAFRYRVASKGRVLLSRSPVALADFKERSWDEYLDFRPVAMQYLRELA